MGFINVMAKKTGRLPDSETYVLTTEQRMLVRSVLTRKKRDMDMHSMVDYKNNEEKTLEH